jgi:predicted enzyme related to lactoylglutathione lyase
MMRLHSVRIPCRKLGESAAFYVKVLGVKPAFGSADGEYVGFRLDSGTVLLEPEDAEEFASGRYLGFSLETDDIQAFYRDASERGVTFTGPPMRQPWGGTMTHVEDCNGNIFSIVQVGED